MPRTTPWILYAIGVLATCTTAAGCGRKSHSRASSYTPPPTPAGFIEQSGAGWRLAIPSTWKYSAQNGPAAFAVSDPQTVDDFHAYANVLTEPFPGQSDQYAKASEAGLRREPRATVEVAREDVVDGDSTLILESRWAPAAAGSVPYRTMQAALASHGTGYVVTCAVATSAFERYRSTCESIVRSFAIQR